VRGASIVMGRWKRGNNRHPEAERKRGEIGSPVSGIRFLVGFSLSSLRSFVSLLFAVRFIGEQEVQTEAANDQGPRTRSPFWLV
jgi:hypothetical protein